MGCALQGQWRMGGTPIHAALTGSTELESPSLGENFVLSTSTAWQQVFAQPGVPPLRFDPRYPSCFQAHLKSTMARENPQKQVEAAQISERRREGEPQPKGGGANRSRLPTPTQLTARRPSPPAPPSARRPPTGGGGATVATPRSSQLRLPTLSSAACADTTPRNFSRTASTPRGGPPPTAAQAHRSSGTHLAQACPGSSSSYRDALVTPRAAGSSLPPQPQTERRQIDAPGGIAGSGSGPQPAPPAGLQQGSGAQQAVAARQEESRLLAQQQARAGHEEERLKQQIRCPGAGGWGSAEGGCRMAALLFSGHSPRPCPAVQQGSQGPHNAAALARLSQFPLLQC